jgi:hypothetical protein
MGPLGASAVPPGGAPATPEEEEVRPSQKK